MDLDFSKCKTKEDVEKIFADNKTRIQIEMLEYVNQKIKEQMNVWVYNKRFIDSLRSQQN